MSKEYTPRQGSIASRVMSLLAGRGSLSGAEVADLLGINHKALSAQISRAVSAGLITAERDGLRNIYSLGDGTAAVETSIEDEGSEQAEAFSCGLFSDGELCLMAAGKEGDVQLILTREQTIELVNYLFRFEYSTEPGEVFSKEASLTMPSFQSGALAMPAA